MIKTFVLDTNVLLHSAHAVDVFADNNVAIPMAVIEELDKFKKNHDELGRNSRRVIRGLDFLRTKGNLAEGVSMKHLSNRASGKIRIISAKPGEGYGEFLKRMDEAGWIADKADNRILAAALLLKKKLSEPVIFVSKDINLRLKADALGLKVADFEQEKVDDEKLYTGFKSVDVPEEKLQLFWKERTVPADGIALLPNEFVILQSNSNPKHRALARLGADGKLVMPITPEDFHAGRVMPRNIEQRMALELLFDPNVRLVTLVGGAGTGKTLLALAAGMVQTLDKKLYERILVSRPIIPLGNDIGFLPGDKNSKLQSWMQPIFDNLEFLLENGDLRNTPEHQVEKLMNAGTLQLEAITYIRGRSIPSQFVIIDEAQNLTPHEIKTIISRAGEGTKMILTGDPRQIDNPYLDASSNGLSVTVEQFKNEPVFGHVTLRKSERSELAALAAKLL